MYTCVCQLAEELVRCVHHVQEPIFVSLLVVDLAHGGGHTGKTLVVD